MRRRRKNAGSADILTDYSELSEIGQGPFATVYGAVEKASGMPVALKVFQPGADVFEVLRRDFEGFTRVDHPNLITPRRLGLAADGSPTVVSDLCGDSLAHVIGTRGPMPPHDVAAAGVKIAGALATLHDSGLLHQNVKPQNLVLTLMGEPALSDPGQVSFQLSVRALASGAEFSGFHTPPEMFEAHEVSAATDVYGLASTMYQLLSGRAPFQPFDGESAISVVLRILRDPVGHLPATIPFPLVELIVSALAKSPDRRPGSAATFADALREVAAHEGWTIAIPPAPPRDTRSAVGSPDPTEQQAPQPSALRFLRRNRRGVSPPSAGERNVVLPEGARHGSMDRPPRKS